MIAAGMLMIAADCGLGGAGTRFFTRAVLRRATIAARHLPSVEPDYGNASTGGNYRDESARGLSSITMRDNFLSPRLAAVPRKGKNHIIRMHPPPAPRQPIRRKQTPRPQQDRT